MSVVSGGEKPRRRKKVLVADESITIQKLVHLGLASSSFEVVAASDGQDALQKIKTFRPDLVLADTGLRHLDGFQLVEKIRTDSSLTNIKTILLKGPLPKGKESRIKEVPVDDVISKPFDARSLADIVHKVLLDEESTALGMDEEKTPIVRMVNVQKGTKIEPFQPATKEQALNKKLAAIAAEVQTEDRADDYSSLDENTAKVAPENFKNPVNVHGDSEKTVVADPLKDPLPKSEIERVLKEQIQGWIQSDLKPLAERLIKEEILKMTKGDS